MDRHRFVADDVGLTTIEHTTIPGRVYVVALPDGQTGVFVSDATIRTLGDALTPVLIATALNDFVERVGYERARAVFAMAGVVLEPDGVVPTFPSR